LALGSALGPESLAGVNEVYHILYDPGKKVTIGTN
jgi:hypothetical protein